MERLTKENVKEMNMLKLSHNQVFVRDRWAWYRDYEREVSATDLAKEMLARNGIEYPLDQEEFDEYMLELLQDGYETIDGMIAMIYRFIWSMADVREQLKTYEDTGLTPEEVKKLVIDVSKGDIRQHQEKLMKMIRDRYDAVSKKQRESWMNQRQR